METLTQTLSRKEVQRAVRCKLVVFAVQRKVLGTKARSQEELRQRIMDELKLHPAYQHALQEQGLTVDTLVNKWSAYAQ